MNSVNKTLYIPLYGKALVSRQGRILHDPRAEQIWEAEGFPLRGKSASKWLAYYMGMRAAVYDQWLRERLEKTPEAVVLHLGCGLDSRAERVGTRGRLWLDVDLAEVIAERKRFFREDDRYQMRSGDLRERAWLDQIPGGHAIVVMEGVSMYLEREALERLLRNLGRHFGKVELLMDCYTCFAARASRYANPVREVGVGQVYGIDDPDALGKGAGLPFLREHEMTPGNMIHALPRREQGRFRLVYGGAISRRLYRLYEFRKEE